MGFQGVNESGVGISKDLIEDFLCVDGLPITKSPLYKGDDSIMLKMTNRDPRFRNMINNRFMPYTEVDFDHDKAMAELAKKPRQCE